MVALVDHQRTAGWRKFGDLPQKSLHLKRLRFREQVYLEWASSRDLATVESLDAVISNELGQIVGAVKAHIASGEKRLTMSPDLHDTTRDGSRGTETAIVCYHLAQSWITLVS
jgi:hypothetical protein